MDCSETFVVVASIATSTVGGGGSGDCVTTAGYCLGVGITDVFVSLHCFVDPFMI